MMSKERIASMKKLLTILTFILINLSCNAADNIKVVALEEFKTENPSKTFDVRVLEDSILGKYELSTNTLLHCEVIQTVDPKRGKRNATFYVKPVSYTNNNQTTKIKEDIYGKYSKTVLSKEELKKIPPAKVIKKTAVMVGNYFVKGLSVGVSFVEGVAKNNENNRLKSGVVNAYEESPLSYIGEGEQLDIKVGDDFYLVFKTDEDEQNYTYTVEEQEEEK